MQPTEFKTHGLQEWWCCSLSRPECQTLFSGCTKDHRNRCQVTSVGAHKIIEMRRQVTSVGAQKIIEMRYQFTSVGAQKIEMRCQLTSVDAHKIIEMRCQLLQFAVGSLPNKMECMCERGRVGGRNIGGEREGRHRQTDRH